LEPQILFQPKQLLSKATVNDFFRYLFSVDGFINEKLRQNTRNGNVLAREDAAIVIPQSERLKVTK